MSIAYMTRQIKRNITPMDLAAAKALSELWAEFKASTPGMTESKIAEQLGISQSMFNQLKKGTVTWSTDHVLKMSAFFRVPTNRFKEIGFYPQIPASDWPAAEQIISDYIFEPPCETIALKSVPLVGEVKGGSDGFLEELQYPVGHGDGFVDWPTKDKMAYALRVRGDSMHPRYRAGEFVIVEPSIEAPVGEDVVVRCTDGRKMLKVLNWIRDGEAQFLSINNGYAPLTIPLREIESIQYAAGRAPRSCLKHG